MKITREPFSMSLFNELLPVGRKCWAENTQIKGDTCSYHGNRDFDVEPDVDQYRVLDDLGLLVLLTLRKDRLVGYVIGILYRSMHHRGILCALGDGAYVEPEYRSYVGPLVESFEKELSKEGVAQIGWPTHRDGSLYKILSARGYSPDETVMEFRLNVRSDQKCA
jgi:hypothetical protein